MATAPTQKTYGVTFPGHIPASAAGDAKADAALALLMIDAKLELKVQQSPDEESNYLVLADALSEASDPRDDSDHRYVTVGK